MTLFFHVFYSLALMITTYTVRSAYYQIANRQIKNTVKRLAIIFTIIFLVLFIITLIFEPSIRDFFHSSNTPNESLISSISKPLLEENNVLSKNNDIIFRYFTTLFF
jgi:hypothetical protein